MLVLVRDRNQVIDVTIGGVKAAITVIGIRRDGKVKIGLEGPPEMVFYRREVTERIAQQQSDAIRRANGNHRDGGIEP